MWQSWPKSLIFGEISTVGMLHNVYNIYKYVYTHTKECLKLVWRWPCEHFEKTEKTDDLEVIYYQSSWLSCLHPSLDENVTDPFFNFIVDYQIIFFLNIYYLC